MSALALTGGGQRTFLTPSLTGAPQTLTEYDVSLTLLHPQTSRYFSHTTVVTAMLAPQGFEVILGRDVLQNCLLIYDGQAGTFTLSF